MPKSVSQAVTAFFEDDEIAKLAKASLKRQRIMINRVTNHIGLAEPAAKISRGVINQALNDVRGSAAESSMNAYRSDLRRFGGWLVQNDFTKSDPASHLHDVKTDTDPRKRKPLNAGQARSVIAVAKAIHPRDGMTALLMLTSGLRESEVVNLQWKHVDEEAGEINAKRFKTRKILPVHITPQLKNALEEWRAFYEAKHGPIEPQSEWYVVPALAHRSDNPGYLWMNSEWPMKPEKPQHSVGTRVKIWLAAVGEKNLTGRASHTLRRTAANILLDLCNDIRVVQTFLGHKDVRMTELYLDIDAAQTKLKNTVQELEI